ncbi:MAG: YlaH-like family protein [Paenibacillus macerans]|uniref:YlaH-like family protein n=1 Tax=Paenibacillus macerans TaxID=44252 RepID=A0A090ZFB4_PAEMA|nr:YlaH-like family protein [Paenibacillus macerans]KFN10004.1 ylaH-like family protein [Paenibacillus macerans]MCY7557481.1 YlaH-like family protein [Paenibacillus macerans]MDU7473732.1 YlaH-like family protein [Paenibacillus macerans]MEC0137074.1 YlaH-like family protein [Paenibacillus macerans]MEC0153243.1 YlaH-like family protein [Paenibacillus macerans]
MQAWFAQHPVISYLLILVLIIFVYNKVFRAQQKLPLWKEAILYLLMAIGSFLLLIFQIDKLPIIQCLLVAVALMLMVRIRYFVEGRQKKKDGANPTSGDKSA